MKNLPARAANASLPISERSFHFVALLRDCHSVSSTSISSGLLGGRRVCRTPDPKMKVQLLDRQVCPSQLGSLEVCELSGKFTSAYHSCVSLVLQL